MPALFPFAQYWWLYAAFTGSVLVLRALALGVFHREAHAVGAREAAVWSGVWVALALAFNLALWRYALWAFPRDPRLAAAPRLPAEAAGGGAPPGVPTGATVPRRRPGGPRSSSSRATSSRSRSRWTTSSSSS